MTWPICGSQVNVPDPAADEDDEAAEDEDDELAGTATDQVPASPSVAFSSVWLVSDCRVTVAVPVWYPLLALAGWPDPRNAPLASAAPTAATATTTTTPATTQPRRPGRPGRAARPPPEYPRPGRRPGAVARRWLPPGRRQPARALRLRLARPPPAHGHRCSGSFPRPSGPRT